MKQILISIAVVISCTLFAQNQKSYLKQNRYDLYSDDFSFPEKDFNIIGFGALHGSAKTYEAEIALIKALLKDNHLKYYIPEVNYSQAYYFNKFLQTGDEKLLEDLVLSFQTIVSQEGSIETFNFWKELKSINDSLDPEDKIEIIGLDAMFDYQYPIIHLCELVIGNEWENMNLLKKQLELDTMNFNASSKSYSTFLLKNVIEEYDQDRSKFGKYVSDAVEFNHIVKNIKYNFQKNRWDRDSLMFDNYLALAERLKFRENKQFFKLGVSHIFKARGFQPVDYSYFFTRLVEKGVFDKSKILTIIGYLTNSKVMWDKIYDNEGNYRKYTIKRGYGISDYWLEYYKGIKYLKRTKLSDLTLYRLNKSDSPYNQVTDLIELKKLFGDFNSKSMKGKNTLQLIDYAILISNSNEQKPLEEK